MSIWSSIDMEGPEVLAVNVQSAQYDDELKGTGTADIFVDVATALPWHDRIRLSMLNDDSQPRVDLVLMLSPDAAELLAARLVQAVAEAREPAYMGRTW